MGIFSSFFKTATAGDHDMSAINEALEFVRNHREKANYASEQERQMAEEAVSNALSFLKANNVDV